MKRLLTLMTPALLLAAALLLAPGAATPATPTPPDRLDLTPAPIAPPIADDRQAEPAGIRAETEVVEKDASEAATTPESEAGSLVAYLRAWAEGPSGASPTHVYDEIAQLVTARPEAADAVVAESTLR